MLSNWFCTSILTFPFDLLQVLLLINSHSFSSSTEQHKVRDPHPVRSSQQGHPWPQSRLLRAAGFWNPSRISILQPVWASSSIFPLPQATGMPCFPHTDRCTGKELFELSTLSYLFQFFCLNSSSEYEDTAEQVNQENPVTAHSGNPDGDSQPPDTSRTQLHL